MRTCPFPASAGMVRLLEPSEELLFWKGMEVERRRAPRRRQASAPASHASAPSPSQPLEFLSPSKKRQTRADDGDLFASSDSDVEVVFEQDFESKTLSVVGPLIIA